jgi:hypothetical protein
MTLKAVPTDPAAKLADHVNKPEDVKLAISSIAARMDRIKRVLGMPAALPEARRRAKDDLVALSRECLTLWALI